MNMRISESIYRVLAEKRIFSMGLMKGTEKALKELHPGENADRVKQLFFTRKIDRCFLILGIGLLLAAFIHFTSGNKPVSEGYLERDAYGGKDISYSLAVDDGQKSRELELAVSPRVMTEAVFREEAAEFIQHMWELICGENENLENVRYNLILEEEYPEYPFEVSWSSSKPEVIDSAGRVHSEKDGEEVSLTCTLYYGDYSETGELTVRAIAPLRTEEEIALEGIRELAADAEKMSRYEEGVILPSAWGDRKLVWETVKKDYSLYILLSLPCLILAVYFLSDYDLIKEAGERKKRLKKEYPEFVNKLVLFVGAGMSVRGAFGKLMHDYADKDSPCGTEIRLLCGKLAAGTSESIAYEQFGRRTGVRDYIRLSALLTQNLKRGNSALLERLIREAERSSEEDLLAARKKGEEAGTKLLLPMVLLLGIIMIVIIVPAFTTL